MARIAQDIIDAVRAYAPGVGVEAAGLMAVIATETGGRPFESADLDSSDGTEPAMLYERHIAYRLFKAKGAKALAEATRQGLVTPKWQGPGSAQYADQKTSAGRLALIARAAALDPEIAYASCSMGLFQVMGGNHKSCGFSSAVEMHHTLTMGGIEAHLACGIAFLRSNGFLKHLAGHDWARLARGYKGTAYAKNQYDKKLASNYATWATVLRTGPATVSANADGSALRLGANGSRVVALQEALKAYGIPVDPDGDYGPATRRAVAAAQVELGLVGNGVATAAFIEELEAAEPISKGARALVTAKDLRAKGDPQVKLGTRIQQVGLGAVGLMGTGQAVMSQASETVDQVRTAKDTVTNIVGETAADMATAWVVAHWPLLVGGGAAASMVLLGGYVVSCAVTAHRTGRTV